MSLILKNLQFRLYLVFLSALKTHSAYADIINISPNFKSQNIGTYVNYMVDKTLNVTFEDAKKSVDSDIYTKSLSDSKGFGVGKNSLWMYFDVKNFASSHSQLYLISQIPLYEAVLYFEQDGYLIEKKSGFKHPHSDWDMSHNRVIFKLDLPAYSKTQRFFLRIETDGVLAFDWIMADVNHTNSLITQEKFLLGAFLGLIAIMIFYNLFLFISIREISYLYYVLYLACFFMLTFGIDGLSFQYLWPNYVEWNLRSFTFFAALSSIFATLFARSFLKIPNVSKIVNSLSLFLVAIFTIHWLLCIFLSIDANNERGNILGAVQLLSLIFFGSYSLYKGQKQARFFLVAILFLSTGSICYILSNLNIIESTIISKYGLHIGASLEILFFSLALADRINIEKKEKLLAQKVAITAMKRTEKIKDEIMANTSHELLTPLTGITGISESLIEGSLGSLNKNIVENLRIIMNSSKRLTKQVHDILDLSKIKNNKVHVNCRPILLNQIVKECIALLLPLVKNREIKIINELDPDTIVYADNDRIYQIFNNLIGNAIKFTKAGEIRIAAETHANHVEIKVSDTGIGIDPVHQKRIFESFEQADGSISRSYGGSGLGLAITKNLIEIQGGSIGLNSQLGKGSTFVFTLPRGDNLSKSIENEPENIVKSTVNVASQHLLIDSAEDESKELSSNTTGKNLLREELKGAKILAIDDEAVNLQVIQNIMHLEDVEIKLISDPTKVMGEVLNEWIPDLVLLDVMMPELDGYALTREIRKQYNESQLPIILLTAKNQINDLLEGFKAGANDYITKPFSRKEFMARISTQLELKALHFQLEQLVKSRTRELTKALDTQRELQDQLVEAEKMASLGGLVAGVAHEINTPLGVSITASSGIETETNTIKSLASKGLKRSQLQNYFDEVAASSLVLVQNLDRIKDTIEKFKQLAVSFYSDKPHEIVISKVLANIKTLIETNYKEQNYNLSITCKPFVLFSYEHEIEQIIIQLFENAFAHNNKTDLLNIKIEVYEEKSQQIVLVFEDDGQGIAADVIDRIFEPFYTGKRIDGHIGLGLNLIYNLVAHKLQGSITCESKENEYCRFIIKFPMKAYQELKYA